ncbi:diguanylate cyclase [Radiobacillus kanasensis]|uniref:GGDEF domain-containing protein n=1 Tax=Radiobacillus kanasensis TaxID=2844358 RepID=UPI001E3065D5|nr:GGDEF domain-containing protein [Radiobacillus kanasensis]UFT99985.1 diguanylate cyclase [Radiobacillus kanasensis]
MIGQIVNLDKKPLVREILNTLWMIVGLYVLMTSLNMIFTSQDTGLFFQKVVLSPTIELILTVLVLELVTYKEVEYVDYILITGMNVIACIIMLAIYDKPMTTFILIFPILLSLFFYKMRLLIYSVVIAFISVVFVYLFSYQKYVELSASDFILTFALLIGTAFIISRFMQHNFQVRNKLMEIMEEKQELTLKNVHMERLNRIDPVTELYNHRSFHEHLDSIFRIENPEQLEVHVAVLDIDNFKSVNDRFGHLAGDRVIAIVARQIHQHLSADDFPSRYGGEEFSIVSIGKTTMEFYQQVEEIRVNLSQVHHKELNGEQVTISIGVQKLEAGMDKEALFSAADASLYMAKGTGKNNTVVNRGNFWPESATN